MSSVKRYEVNGSSSFYEDEKGSFVDYEDYAALEAKCAALAAENAGLKGAIKEIVDSAEEAEYDGYFSFVVNPDAIHAGADLIESETPATDAFLAEVLASAVDEACLKISNAIINCYQDEQVGLDEAATICGDLAAQLRQGGAE